MGFGSYDESEQQNQEVNTDDKDSGVDVHENDHEGEITFDADTSTDDLLNQLETIKSNDE
ncbi:DUF5786 family protein [Halalkalicoccus salilacus]|uniref:DUF5786 family protein n=1 Tax=Halalkalicoccus TaxID=332246 RepID=UPI002F96971A